VAAKAMFLSSRPQIYMYYIEVEIYVVEPLHLRDLVSLVTALEVVRGLNPSTEVL
jgi:hypothetical protein